MVLSVDFFLKNQFSQKYFSGTLHESDCQTDRIQIRTNVLDLGPNGLQRLSGDDKNRREHATN